jgi:hypothetical protein
MLGWPLIGGSGPTSSTPSAITCSEAIDMDELGTFQCHGDNVNLRYERHYLRPIETYGRP